MTNIKYTFIFQEVKYPFNFRQFKLVKIIKSNTQIINVVCTVTL